jgi:iron-sulfur cluster repair protein YtfE (RIC family)
MSIAELLKSRHAHCDEPFIAMEQRSADGQWASATPILAAFRAALDNHLREEEPVVSPAFEAATGMTQGPTQVMRAEHAQMRALVAQIVSALQGQDSDGISGAADTLLIVMQQHNLKEENILYPMFDRVLPGAALIATLQQNQESSCPT